MSRTTRILRKSDLDQPLPKWSLWSWSAESLLEALPKKRKFDLIITSPPYNLGKAYEDRKSFNKFLRWQADVVESLTPYVAPGGSVCWQVGNYVQNGHVEPLDIYMHPIFKELGFILRNRIIWRFGHGLHCRNRFSGRYEVVLWYTRPGDYQFDLDSVRIPAKYPGKRNGNGRLTSHPKGKNPEDVWDIPNVVGNHKEKTDHPCQFPVGLAERLVLALTRPRGIVFDPFCGSGSAGVAAAVHGRRFLGAEIDREYVRIARSRINDALAGKSEYRPHDQPIYDHKRSKLSQIP